MHFISQIVIDIFPPPVELSNCSSILARMAVNLAFFTALYPMQLSLALRLELF
jgi:hypothetical protein